MDQLFDDPLCKVVRTRELYRCDSCVHDGSNHLEPFSLMLLQLRVDSLQVHVHQVVEMGLVELFEAHEVELSVRKPCEFTTKLRSTLLTELPFSR